MQEGTTRPGARQPFRLDHGSVTTQRRALAILVGAIGLALVVAFIVVGTQNAAPSASPTVAPPASATISAVAASPTVSATASATGVASARYGYVAIGGGGFALVSESGATVHQSACGAPGRPCDQTKIAVSPDGKRVAYWIAAQNAPWELRVFDVASPTSARTVATLPASFLGLGLRWSTDSQGVLFAAETEGYGGIRGGAGRATLSALDLTSAQATASEAMPTRTDGSFYVPVAWDRAKKLFAAVLTGEGGFASEFAVADAAGFRVMKVQGGTSTIAGQIEASDDATRVLGIDIGANVVRIWPIADATKSFDVGPGPGARISAAHWMPSSNNVAWSVGERLDVFIPQTESSRTVYSSSGGVQLVALRPDGTGAVVSSTGGVLIVDMQSGATTRSGFAVGQVVIARGVLLR
jgi:hypothetical protein